MLSKILLYILLLGLFIAGGYWFADGSGDMALQWRNYELTTTTSNFVFFIIFVTALLSIVIPGVIGIFGLPKRWIKARENKKYRQGIEHITHTLTAISSGDVKAANSAAGRARKAFAGQPIVPLLETQIAAASKDQALLQQSLTELQQFKETKALASKGLAEMHMRKGELISAIPFAEKAMELEPGNKQPFLITLALYVKSKQLVFADTLLEDAKKDKVIDKYVLREYKALLAYIRAEQEEENRELAKKHISEAYQLASHQQHIFLRYIALHNDEHSAQEALKVLKRSWEGCFIPALYPLAKDIAINDKDKKKLYKKLLNLSMDGKIYAQLLLADLMLSMGNHKEAVGHLRIYSELTGIDIDIPEVGAKGELVAGEPLGDIIAGEEANMKITGWTCKQCHTKTAEWLAVCSSCQTLNQCQMN